MRTSFKHEELVTNANLSRQETKSLQMHGRIVDATIGSLARQGYAATSISEIVDAAGISRGTLQHHFPKKEDLIIATAEALMARSLKILSEPNNRTTRRLESELGEFWTRLIDTKEYRALLEILNAIRTDKTLRKRILPTLRDWDKSIDHQMLVSYSSHAGKDEEVVLIMAMSRCFLRGLLIQKSFMRDSAAIDTLLKRWAKMVSLYISPR